MPRKAEEVLQYEDFLGWTVLSLKDFLSLRGLKQTGRKPELVAGAFGTYELKAPFFVKALCHLHKKFAMTHTRSGYV